MFVTQSDVLVFHVLCIQRATSSDQPAACYIVWVCGNEEAASVKSDLEKEADAEIRKNFNIIT